MSITEMKNYLSNREYVLFQKYFLTFGIGQEASYTRSANQIITIANYITGAMGGKPKETSVTDIYPQLSYGESTSNGNNAINWNTIDDRLKSELVAAGLYTEEGNPRGYNPHR